LDEAVTRTAVVAAVCLALPAVVSWLEATDASASIRLRRVSTDSASASLALAGTSTSRASGFPRIAVADGEIVVAWRDSSEPARLRTALAELR
jgi:hypothetical protein